MDFFESQYFSLNKRLMVFMGLWPFLNAKERFRKCSLMSAIMVISMIPQFICIQQFSDDTDKVIKAIATAIYLCAIFSKLIMFLVTEEKIKLVFEMISENWKHFQNEKDLAILRTNSEKGRFYTIAYMIYMFFGVTSFNTLPLLPVLVDKIAPINGSRSKAFILDGEYFVDRHENYVKIFLFEGFITTITVFIFCTVDTTYTVCVQQCVALMNIVQMRLRKITNNNKLDCTDFKQYELLTEAIEIHKKSIEFAKLLEMAYSTYLLILLGLNAMIISIGSNVVIMNFNQPMEFIRYAVILIGLAIHMFYISLPGQRLIDASSNIFRDSYNNQWYECSVRTQKILKLMMMRSKRPCELTAGGVYVMNMENCASLAKTSISYVTVFASYRL